MEHGDPPRSSLPTVVRLPARPGEAVARESGIMLDLGVPAPRWIKGLKRGEGRLARDVEAAVDQARQELGIDATTEIVPVVLLYRYGEADYVVVATVER